MRKPRRRTIPAAALAAALAAATPGLAGSAPTTGTAATPFQQAVHDARTELRDHRARMAEVDRLRAEALSGGDRAALRELHEKAMAIRERHETRLTELRRRHGDATMRRAAAHADAQERMERRLHEAILLRRAELEEEARVSAEGVLPVVERRRRALARRYRHQIERLRMHASMRHDRATDRRSERRDDLGDGEFDASRRHRRAVRGAAMTDRPSRAERRTATDRAGDAAEPNRHRAFEAARDRLEQIKRQGRKDLRPGSAGGKDRTGAGKGSDTGRSSAAATPAQCCPSKKARSSSK